MRSSRMVLLFVCLVLGACASQEKTTEPYYTRLYEGSYDEVWLSALRTLADYPLKLSNKDSGTIQTEVITGPYNELLFSYPDTIDLPERYRFTIKMNFARLETEDKAPVTRIRLIKELEKYKDFYSGWLEYTSDGTEEKILLYRIEHLLQMDKLLNKPPE